MSIIPDDQVRTLTPPPSWQETRRENRRQIRQARRKARADAAEKRTRERETAVTSLRDRTERAIRWSAQHGSHCVTINPRDDECRIAETIFEELTDNGYQLTIVLDHTERALKCFDVTWSHDDGSPLTDDERGTRSTCRDHWAPVISDSIDYDRLVTGLISYVGPPMVIFFLIMALAR